MGKLLLLGGSGVDEAPSLKGLKWKKFDTGIRNHLKPYMGLGEEVRHLGRKLFRLPHDGLIEYQETDEFIFIPRHGHSFRYAPSRTQYLANLVAAKILGVDKVIATSACGSLQYHIDVESLVIPDDYVDDSNRDDNVFGDGIVVHGNSVYAFSKGLRKILIETAYEFKDNFNGIHEKGTYVTIPGDRFGTKAEGARRALFADVVGMTVSPEASIAMQLDLEYAVVAFPVDKNLDANHEDGTIAVMSRMSEPNRVPAFVEKVIQKCNTYQAQGCVDQLDGNIIPGDTSQIMNEELEEIADGLIAKYC